MYIHARTKVKALTNIYTCTSMLKTLMNKVTQKIRVHFHERSNIHATNILKNTLALTCMLQYTCTITDAHAQTLNHTLDKTHAQILKYQTIMQQHALNSMHSTACTQRHALNSCTQQHRRNNMNTTFTTRSATQTPTYIPIHTPMRTQTQTCIETPILIHQGTCTKIAV